MYICVHMYIYTSIQVAQLKMNLAAVAEEADTSKGKLEKFKIAAAEKLKLDRAKYLQHLQVFVYVCVCACLCVVVHTYVCVSISVSMSMSMSMSVSVSTCVCVDTYGVATISRLLKIIGLFCKGAL